MAVDIKDKVVFITGGARGIGAEAARQLVAKGAKVALVDLDLAEVQRTASALGGRAAGFAADVTDVVSMRAAVEATIERFGSIDVVIANAGVAGRPSTFRALSQPEFERVIEINVLGVTRTVAATIEHVVARRGYILVISSLSALVPTPFLAAYTTSKHAVDGFARSLRAELAYTGTAAGAAYFGFIDTDMVRDGFADPLTAQANQSLPSVIRRPIPVERAGRAIVHGIEGRRARVTAPWWVLGAWRLRGVLTALDKPMSRRRGVVRALRDSDSTVHKETLT